ncbi:hypothetical protein [Leucobacter ruminantium]|uniref:Tail assembly chaperone n=1 Tax=Leucobacter ruminantium TaxID=1289170 RepID=A0A939RX80_9MICO|nr:hypothetical protein [Leucobacter ruminantium]MBO1805837.1 hypothetical protein [Leucobacter ruminantium]
MTENPAPEIIDETAEATEDELLDVDQYEIPVVEDDSDDRFPCFIAGSTLIVRLDDPGELRLPLKLSYNQIQDLKARTTADADELDQLLVLLEIIGDADLVETLKGIDMADAIAVSLLFFRAWKQRTQVSLGKLRRSPRR